VNFPFGKNRLRKAIERGFVGGKLDEELEELGDLKLKSKADAEAVCWGLQQLQEGTTDIGKKARVLTGLLQEVEDGDCEAAEILRDRGTTYAAAA